jgi:hypothetical protein
VSALRLTTCSLAELAAAARRAVATIGHDTHERYGARKVFLAAVHAALGGEGAIIHVEAFKRRMVSAHRAGLVVLARADLVAAMPGAAVAASEVSDGGAEFHFVLDDAARDPWADDAASSEPLAGRVVAMRHLPPGSSSEVIGEVEHLRYQIARADALLHAADDLLERVGEDRQCREHVAHLVEHVVHLVDLAKQATTTALAMGSELARQLLKGRTEG